VAGCLVRREAIWDGDGMRVGGLGEMRMIMQDGDMQDGDMHVGFEVDALGRVESGGLGLEM
jgi:hypothetical protein